MAIDEEWEVMIQKLSNLVDREHFERYVRKHLEAYASSEGSRPAKPGQLARTNDAAADKLPPINATLSKSQPHTPLVNAGSFETSPMVVGEEGRGAGGAALTEDNLKASCNAPANHDHHIDDDRSSVNTDDLLWPMGCDDNEATFRKLRVQHAREAHRRAVLHNSLQRASQAKESVGKSLHTALQHRMQAAGGGGSPTRHRGASGGGGGGSWR